MTHENLVSQILVARQPFDAAIDAVEKSSKINNRNIQLIINLIEHLFPDIETEKVFEKLENGTFPNISSSKGDLRVNGRLNEENSLYNYLKELNKD